MTLIITNWTGGYLLNLCDDGLKNYLNKSNFEKILKFLTVADNKDKLLKILQYLVKLVIVTRGYIKPEDGKAVDFKSFASTLSLARKLGRLGNWLPGVQDFCEVVGDGPSVDNFIKLIGATASVGNDLLDDWICLQKGRFLLKQSYLDTLDLWSTRLWFISVSIDLNFTLKKLKNLLQTSPQKSENEKYEFHKKRTDLLLTASKQLCDWTFCVWELAEMGRFSERVPVVAGLSAAVIGAIRGWRKIK